MEETTKLEQGKEQEVREGLSSFDLPPFIERSFSWYWFVLSLIIFGSLGAIYLRYTTPMYQSTAKLLIKDESGSNRRGQSLQNMSNLGIISNSTGIDNEMEILTSHSLAEDAIRDLKLYVNYSTKGRVKDVILYRNQPLNVDVDPGHLEKLNAPIDLTITKDSIFYIVSGTYYVPTNDNSNEGPYSINRKITNLPATIATRAGIITISSNYGHTLKNSECSER